MTCECNFKPRWTCWNLLTCDGTIAGKGLAYVLETSRWAQLTTILSDRFKSEKDFGAKFCYSLDRHLQTFFNKSLSGRTSLPRDSRDT